MSAWLAEGRARQKELGRLGEEIARLSAHIQAAIYRLLCMIREFDEREGWYDEGCKSCAQWLSWRTGIGPGAAREKVRVARALGRLPCLSEALRRGELSYSVARALTRVATPENEEELVEVARYTPAAQLERLVAGWRTVDRAVERELEGERHRSRELWVVPDSDGSWVIRGRLDPEVGAVLCRALEAARELLYAGEAAEPEASPEARRADALGLVAESALGGGVGAALEAGAGPGREAGAEGRRSTVSEPGADPEVGVNTDPATDPEGGMSPEPGGRPDAGAEAARPGSAPVVGRAERFQVVVHVDVETLREEADGAGESRIERGPHVSVETSRRLACDAGVVVMTHDGGGNVLDVGRRTRTVPPALRRALNRRDGGCRFPGCASRYCDAHHIRHWADGGETKLDNLALLCRRHHRLVHEEGWRVERWEGGAVRFYRPDGRLLPVVPAPVPVGEDPVAALEREQRGLGIGRWTPTPRWYGKSLDLDWALFTLWRPSWKSGKEPSGKEPSGEHESWGE